MIGIQTASSQNARLLTVSGWKLAPSSLGQKPLHLPARRCATLDDAVAGCDLRDGATIGFHHHFRNGDRVIVAVMQALAKQGLRRLTLVASSIFPTHAPLIELTRSGVIDRIVTDYVKGPVADEIMAGGVSGLCVLQSHGGRARAIASGELLLDATFIGAPLAHVSGAATGRGGRRPCGPLGYAMVDAAHARRTVILADQITNVPLALPDIPAEHVDFLLHFDQPGDPEGIRSGATIARQNQTAACISDGIARVLDAAGVIRPGFSFQTGAGGYSLAAVAMIGERLARIGACADFISGGITSAHVAILKQGLAGRIRDVQSFDLDAVASSIHDPAHDPFRLRNTPARCMPRLR